MIKDTKKRLFEMMAIVDKSFKPKLNEEIDVDESGFPRLKRMMSGDVNSINSIGIFTAENPKAIQLSPEENSIRLNKLKNQIRALGYGYIKITGKYGNWENSLVVPNISEQDIYQLSKDWDQDSYIYGEKMKKTDDPSKVYFKWNMVKTETHEPLDNERYTVLSNRDNLQTADDFFSVIKNIRFKIPFFNDEKYNEPENLDYLDKSTNGNQDIETNDEPDVETNNNPNIQITRKPQTT